MRRLAGYALVAGAAAVGAGVLVALVRDVALQGAVAWSLVVLGLLLVALPAMGWARPRGGHDVGIGLRERVPGARDTTRSGRTELGMLAAGLVLLALGVALLVV